MLIDIQTMKYFFMIYMTTVSVKQVSWSSWFALPILLILFVCFFSFLLIAFVLLLIGKPLILSWTIYFMAGNKSPLRICESMPELFLRRFFRNKIYFIAKKYVVRKNSETNMKTIHAKIDFNWPNHYISGVARTPTNI